MQDKEATVIEFPPGSIYITIALAIVYNKTLALTWLLTMCILWNILKAVKWIK